METKNKIVRYSESFRTDSEIKEPWHYKSMERTVDGVYVVPTNYPKGGGSNLFRIWSEFSEPRRDIDA